MHAPHVQCEETDTATGDRRDRRGDDVRRQAQPSQ